MLLVNWECVATVMKNGFAAAPLVYYAVIYIQYESGKKMVFGLLLC